MLQFEQQIYIERDRLRLLEYLDRDIDRDPEQLGQNSDEVIEKLLRTALKRADEFKEVKPWNIQDNMEFIRAQRILKFQKSNKA